MSKLEKPDWQIQNEDEIIDRFLEDYEDKIKKIFKEWLKSNIRACVTYNVPILYKESRDAQYEEYLDTEEFNDTDVGCSFSGRER
jgi:hypothetical protein